MISHLRAAWKKFCMVQLPCVPFLGKSGFQPYRRKLIYKYIVGKNKDKHPLPWEVRYNVAVAIAEGLNYLHSEHSRPVIHRDVKSSNVLLSDEFEAKVI